MLARGLIVISIAAGISSCATQFSPNDVCAINSPTYDSRQISCQFPKTVFARKLTFKADFSGGHDDTKARIETFIDNAPLKCREGSKTDLFGEDGDVSLWCTFSISDYPQSKGVFTATVRWSHAEYTNYEMTVE